MSSRTVALAAFPGLLLVGCISPHAVSTRTLLAEMTDLTKMAEFPQPPYTCRQFSSYDRASSTSQDPETWFANNDCGVFLRTEERDGRKEWVMMDADGPGAIVRIWSANPEGNIRIYLDHNDTPVIAARMSTFLSGKLHGIPDPISHERSKGWNCYLPIPYARHCKVTSDKDGFYYHVNYRTYPAGTKVVTFSSRDLDTLGGEIRGVAATLRDPRQAGLAEAEKLPVGYRRTTLFDDLELAPGATVSKPAPRRGPVALAGLTAEVKADQPLPALRALVLGIDFDGHPTVACPLGDFFGAGPGVTPYASLPLGIDADGTLWSNWVMPYRELATVTVHNAGSKPVHVRVTVVDRPYTWTDQSMYFHAGWAVEHDYPTRPFTDWNYVTAHGKGVYAGSAFTIANPVKAWWGEGDEKIYADGEKSPSHFGTGTEDYFGYAWCWPVPFTHAYHNQPQCDGPGNYGRSAVNRWHILDRIPFTSDLRFDMEIWHWWDGLVPEFSVVTYWYARPGATDNRPAQRDSDLTLVSLPPYAVYRVGGAIEGEALRIVARTGTAEPQEIDKCSNEKHLWWHGANPDDKLVLAFPAPRAGKYHVYGRFVKAKNYGIARLTINGQPAGEPLDLFHERVVAADEVRLGSFDLLDGDNTLSVEIIGANAQATPEYMFGLDYLRLEPAE